MTSIRNNFTQSYGLAHPFACAGLAFAGTTSSLAIAVSKAGGLGAVGMGKMPPPYLEQVIGEIRAATDKPFNINFITIFTDEAHIDECVRLKPPVVSFHWGHPEKAWIDKLKQAGIKVWEQVGSKSMAAKAIADGIDLIIAQGTEAGGHNFAELPLFVILPEILSVAGDIPVLAAGGIVDGKGVAAAMALGATGVWVGTRMAATLESDIAQGYKDYIVKSSGEDTVLSSLFGNDTPDFNPMRVLKNGIVEEWTGAEHNAPTDPFTQEVVGNMEIAGMPLEINKFSNLVPTASATGDIQQMPLLCGQGCNAITTIKSAQEVIEEMMAEACDTLQTLTRGICQ